MRPCSTLRGNLCADMASVIELDLCGAPPRWGRDFVNDPSVMPQSMYNVAHCRTLEQSWQEGQAALWIGRQQRHGRQGPDHLPQQQPPIAHRDCPARSTPRWGWRQPEDPSGHRCVGVSNTASRRRHNAHGHSIIFQLYQDSLPWASGGEYLRFFRLVRTLVVAWRNVGLEPIFVFDGMWSRLLFLTMAQPARCDTLRETCDIHRARSKAALPRPSLLRRLPPLALGPLLLAP